MTDQSIFGNQNPLETPANPGAGNAPNGQIDPAIATLLGEIRNERGEPKYKSLNDAIIALKHSQEYIPQISAKLQEKESEIERLRKEADKMAELERSVQALTQRQTEAPTSAQGMSEEQIADLVTKTLSRNEQIRIAKENQQAVVSQMKASFGTEAENVFNKKAQELGMTVEELNALAARTPKAVLNLIGVSKPVTTGAPSATNLNTSGFTPRPNSHIGRNTTALPVGATSQELAQESQRSKAMIEELEAEGMSIEDMTNPKNYFKYFK